MSKPSFTDLVDVMARLRAPNGCPWDREQTHETLKPYLIEESYEVLTAIDEQDDTELKKELGDVLLQVLFHSQIASETERFDVLDVVEELHDKLIRRHPHVFANLEVNGTQEVLQNWGAIKAQEKASAGKEEKKRFLDSVSSKMPPLVEARQLTERAAYVGFDWEKPQDCIDKLFEEAAELKAELDDAETTHQRLADEVGDLLFVAVNIARLLKVDPDSALKNANRKFRRRFGFIEDSLGETGKSLKDSHLDEMEALWQKAKSLE
ncbi:MAG: nucleoside triphosphate pyrophosphohydrolase [Blastocatellia bacterium]|nr:nucleoside triphosphate pyrophosphohydrolase [Blastocatellia bacterium]